MVVPTDAGGSADRIGRLYAKYLPKFLPGSPNVIVRNMPGGNTIIAANFFYGSKTDGLTLYTSPSSTALEDLLGNKALKFSLRELTAVAAPPASTNVVFVRPEVIEKPEDILKAQRLIWGQGAGSSTSFLLAAEMIGIPVAKAVFSWSGQADAFRAFLAGETNISSVSSTGFDAQVKPFVERGEAKLLMQSGMIDETGSVIRHPSFPNLMTVVDLGEKVNGKAPSGMAFDVFKAIAASLDSMKQILFLPPNTPDSIVQAYWDSADKMVKDPDFLKESSALTDAGDTWRAGKAFDQMFHKSYGMKPEASEWLKNTMQTKYGLVLQ
ncbi:MAG: hypothetical protein HY675_23325 [Chloroflexi bacterium]|nr:hypothetical protein [Chloroflexota bacterium]